LNRIFSRKNLVLVILVASVAASISAISYQYSLYTSQQIEELAVQEIRSNSDIQAHDLANAFSNRLGDVVNTLQVISHSRSVLGGNVENAKSLFNQADDSSEFTDFYMWLNGEGRIVWISNINQTTYEQYRDTDLSYRLYFITPRDTGQLYYSSVVDSNDRVPRLYVSYPILGEQPGQFMGVVASGIRSDAIGNFLQGQLSPKLQSDVVLLDNTGIVLYSKDPQYVGRNVFGIKFQSFLASSDPETQRAMNEGFTEALAGNDGMKEIVLNGERATFVYKPIILEGKQFGVLYMVTSHAYASDVVGLIDQQKNFSLMLIVMTSAAAVAAILVILTWNKRLEQTVDAKTAELRVANEQLQAHDKMQREFINIAAHELRTPIQPILGMTEMLENELGDKREDIRIIARNARRLERLTRDLLDVAKIEGNSLKLNKEKFSINELVSVLVEDYRRRFANSHDLLIEYAPQGDIVVEADRERITQVISNLLDNALKFTKTGKIIIATKKESDGKLTVSVEDTGKGIEPEIIPWLFTKFASKSQSGTGLGLFISKSIVEAHGGQIWGKNNESEGATFTFTIPQVK
jgi:signal transduction histidine kinase